MHQARASILFEGVPEDALFYYVHSFRIVCGQPDIVIGECEYGQTVTAAFQQGNVFGTQFHPEKSQLHGLTLLRNFLERS
jgi:imidazole glycerol-phosphate synthase subunit HisH